MSLELKDDTYVYCQFYRRGKRVNLCVGKFNEKGRFVPNKNTPDSVDYLFRQAFMDYDKAMLLRTGSLTIDDIKKYSVKEEEYHQWVRSLGGSTSKPSIFIGSVISHPVKLKTVAIVKSMLPAKTQAAKI